MKFGERIRATRAQLGLTQEQMADRLGVSRQAISNWENDRNLPDIEMLITMAMTFDLSLDELILGDRSTNMTIVETTPVAEKLIRDGSEGRRQRWVAITAGIGTTLLLAACALFTAAALGLGQTGPNIDSHLWMSALALLLLFVGMMVFLSCGLGALVSLVRGKDNRRMFGIVLAVSVAAIVGIAVFFALLIAGNSIG